VRVIVEALCGRCGNVSFCFSVRVCCMFRRNKVIDGSYVKFISLKSTGRIPPQGFFVCWVRDCPTSCFIGVFWTVKSLMLICGIVSLGNCRWSPVREGFEPNCSLVWGFHPDTFYYDDWGASTHGRRTYLHPDSEN